MSAVVVSAMLFALAAAESLDFDEGQSADASWDAVVDSDAMKPLLDVYGKSVRIVLAVPNAATPEDRAMRDIGQSLQSVVVSRFAVAVGEKGTVTLGTAVGHKDMSVVKEEKDTDPNLDVVVVLRSVKDSDAWMLNAFESSGALIAGVVLRPGKDPSSGLDADVVQRILAKRMASHNDGKHAKRPVEVREKIAGSWSTKRNGGGITYTPTTARVVHEFYDEGVHLSGNKLFEHIGRPDIAQKEFMLKVVGGVGLGVGIPILLLSPLPMLLTMGQPGQVSFLGGIAGLTGLVVGAAFAIVGTGGFVIFVNNDAERLRAVEAYNRLFDVSSYDVRDELADTSSE